MMTTRSAVRFVAGLSVLAAACASQQERADTTSLLAIDTLKPATTSLAPDTGSTTGIDSTPAPTKTGAATKTKSAATKTATKQGETKELGRDSIIRVDTKDKRRQLPPADTGKRP
jgi:hypothetical protein